MDVDLDVNQLQLDLVPDLGPEQILLVVEELLLSGEINRAEALTLLGDLFNQ